MARIFNCGWEGGTIHVSDTSAGGSLGNDTAGGWSQYCYHGGGISSGTEFNLAENNSELYGGVRFKTNGISGAGTAGILLFRDETFAYQNQFYVKYPLWGFQTSGGVEFLSTQSMAYNQWYWLEWHVLVSDTVGVFQLKVNGQLVLDLSNIDTKGTTSSYIRWVQVVNSGVGNYDAAFDDLVVNNVTNDGGPLVTRSWPGEVGVMGLPVTADTSVTDWIQSGVDAGTPGAYSTEVLADSPKLFLRLNETSGSTANDSSGLGHNGTFNGTNTILNQPGIDGDGPAIATGTTTSDYVNVPDHADLNPTAAITVEAWVKGFYSWAAGDQAVIAQKWNQYSVRYDSGTNLLYWSIWTGSTRRDCTFAMVDTALPITFDWRNDHNFHHIVCTWDDAIDTMAIYVDGFLWKTQTQAGPMDTSTNAFRLGSGTAGFINSRTQYIDDVAIYNTALSQTRIRVHHKAGQQKYNWVNDDARVNYSLVGNEDLKYLMTSAAGNKQLFDHQDTDPGFPLVQGLTVYMGARKDQPADGTVAALVKRAGVEAAGQTNYLNSTYDVYRTTWSRDPTDNTDWTVAKVNALDYGFKSV